LEDLQTDSALLLLSRYALPSPGSKVTAMLELLLLQVEEEEQQQQQQEDL
jgi:hypothetical protein